MTALPRRAFLQITGGLVVSFTWPRTIAAQGAAPSARAASDLDAWLAIAADGAVTLYTGKVELGTGVETALSQLVAEELDVPVARVTVVQGDTARTPDQGLTTGSKTLQQGGPPIRQAAAEARRTLLGLAATRLGTPIESLSVRDGVVRGGARTATYAELLGGRRFARTIDGTARPKAPATYRVVGKPIPRVDIPAKAFGTFPFTQNVRVPGMWHGRVVRPPVVGATVTSIDEASIARLPGTPRVVRGGDFVGVVAEREEHAIAAASALKVEWREPPATTDTRPFYDRLRATPAREVTLTRVGDVDAALARLTPRQATYRWPFQMHASIGPSCAVADVRAEAATVWCASQGVFGLRDALASLLGLPTERVRAVFVEGAGCYGHNGADDVAADAALLSQALGRPVRVQWMRHDEHGWEPKGPAMVMEVRGAVERGRIAAWDYAVWTPTHSTRPRSQAGNLLAGQLVGQRPRYGQTGGDRNARHGYAFPNDRVVVHWLSEVPLRPSALRGLGAPQNTFANESFMDELASAAGVDPVEFRLHHLDDPRGVAVIRAAAARALWSPRGATTRRENGTTARGRGFAYVQYETEFAYVAAMVDADVDRKTGAVRIARVVVAHDCGLVVNPDGLRNQIEGNVIQAISRALKEEVRFAEGRVTSLDWKSYPIITFPEVPDAIEIVLLDRPELPALGAGEPATCPIPAAIANAIFAATGARVRTVPFTPERVREALAAAG